MCGSVPVPYRCLGDPARSPALCMDLPLGDDDFTNRWRLIKQGFSKALPMTERRSSVRAACGERAIWQRRFWEHVIRSDRDYSAHVDYRHGE